MGYSVFTQEHEDLRKKIREFVQTEIAPHVDRWEKQEYFDDWVFPRMGELGFLALRYPKEYGGGGWDYLAGMILSEELACCGAGGLALATGVQTDMAIPPILEFGTESQKEKYFIPAIKGQKVACLGITEPNAGSDVSSIQTRAVRDGDHWVINGSKTFITNGTRGGFITLVAKTNPELGYNGVSLFIVESGTPGYRVTRKLKKVGMICSDTAELVFEDCRVPAENLLGKEGRGFHQIMWELQGERMIGCAVILAPAVRAFEKAREYARTRMQMGKPLVNYQAISHRLAEVAIELEAARQMVYATAKKFGAGDYPVKEISMCKLVSAKVASKVADLAVQIYGGYGILMDCEAQRFWRDSRLYHIGGGTDEVMKDVIAKTMGL